MNEQPDTFVSGGNMDVSERLSPLFHRRLAKDIRNELVRSRSSLEICKDRLHQWTGVPTVRSGVFYDGRRSSLPDSFKVSEESSDTQMIGLGQNQSILTSLFSNSSNLAPHENLSRSENDPEELFDAMIDEISAETVAEQSLVVSNETSAQNVERDVEPVCIALQIPPEVLFRIFANFSVEELGRLGAVCRYWFRVAHDPLLWRRVYIRRQCSVETALDLLSYAVHPETVHISNNAAVNTLMTSSSFFTSSLRCLDLGFSELTQDTLQLLYSTRLSRLVHLNLEGCKIVDEVSMSKICASCTALERVTFSHCFNVCDDAVTALCSLSHLTHVNLDGVEWISDKGVAKLVSHHGSQLEAVWLDGANLTDVTIRWIYRCPRLHLLSIRFCEAITDFATIARIPTLTSLTLRKASQVTRNNLKDLLSPLLSKLSNLHYLDLSECNGLTDDDVTDMTALCGQKLKHLILDWCWEVTDLGLISIVEKCSVLEWLSLAGLHNLSGIPLKSYPESLPRLVVLNLANCNRIQDDIIKSLVDDNPRLIAFNYYGDRFETEDADRPELTSEHSLWRIANPDYSRICQC